MTSLVTLNDHAVSRASVVWPAWGLWWANVDLTDPEELTGRVSLSVGGKVFSGTVISGGVYNGRASYRIVAGAGGVNAPLPNKGYVNDAGVALAIVLSDAARSAKEAISGAPTTRLGPHYARQEGETFGDLLQRHAPRAWYGAADGTITLGTHPATTYKGDAPRTRVDVAGGVIDLTTDTLDGLAPGVQIDGAQPATDLQIELTPERMTVRVYSAARTTRELVALHAIVRAAFPSLAYLGCWEYRVVTQAGERLNLQPVRVASGMPDLRNVPVRPGIAGAKALVAPGELVLVCFADGDPSRPNVFAHDAADSPGWMPLELDLGGPGALGIARIGDTVQAGPYTGIITSASARIKASA